MPRFANPLLGILLMSDQVQQILVPFLGALQASIAVLLTILAGVVAAQFDLIGETSAKEISKLCVKLFLPALLIVNVGSQLHLDTAIKYVPIVIWSSAYSVLSLLFGMIVTRIFDLPEWATPAIAFNNTTSIPLLLVQALDSASILGSIDSGDDAVNRAKSFFLVNSMISNSLTFALGPKFMKGTKRGEEEEGPPSDEQIEAQEQEAEQANEETSLLPNAAVRQTTQAEFKAYKSGTHIWTRLPSSAQTSLQFLYSFVNAPLIGAVLGAVIGLVPPIHRLFFEDQQHGGYLNAWLTSAIQNLGDLFAALQVLVVGVKLSRAMLGMKKGESSGKIPWPTSLLIFFVRFIFWPAVAIPLIYVFATKTGLLDQDPLLWFCMMLMPTGPPALTIMSLAETNNAGKEEGEVIAKFLTLSYAISPVICFAVVGSLRASETARNS